MASQNDIDKAWEKAHPIKGANPNVYRKDDYGHKIRKASYGTKGEFGWELDHKNPSSKGGTDCQQNMQPLHWQENRQKGNTYPYKKK